MNKPLHKDPSFWIVAITLVGAANVAQINFGVPWLREKVAASRPAPRMANAVPVMNGINERPDLDFSKKTYSWQRPQFDPRILQDTPPQVVLIASEYNAPSGGWGTSGANNALGIRMQALYVVQCAYGWGSSLRMVQADPLPAGEFDFIANLPSGALEALQAEIKKQWGIVANREIRQTNVVLLKLDHTNAPGLQPVTAPTAPPPGEARVQTVRSSVGGFLVSYLESVLQLRVIDQTGLTEVFDIQFPARVGQNKAFEQNRKILLEQFGLDLVQTNAPIEMLVVKKVSGGNP